MESNKGVPTREGMKLAAKEAALAFKEYTRWDDDIYNDYNLLLEELKRTNSNKSILAKDKGKALENIVTFIIEKSNILDVYENIRTGTNEIDQVVILNDDAIFLHDTYNISPKYMGIDSDYFICECKNYEDSVGGTWVGKFYSLLRISGNCRLGIIFSYKGLSGKEDDWRDAHGITKIIYRIEPEDEKIYILDFNIKDFERIYSNKETFFEIIKSKKKALKINASSEKLMEKHDNEEKLKEVIDRLKAH